jgi:hypothetical protein
VTHLPLLRSLGLSVRALDGKLLAAPKERLDADCRDYLRLHKAAVLAELAEEEAGRIHEILEEVWPS